MKFLPLLLILSCSTTKIYNDPDTVPVALNENKLKCYVFEADGGCAYDMDQEPLDP